MIRRIVDRDATTHLPPGRDGTRWTTAHRHKALAVQRCRHPWNSHCLRRPPRSSCFPQFRPQVPGLLLSFRAVTTNWSIFFLADSRPLLLLIRFSFETLFSHHWHLRNASGVLPAAFPSEHQSFLLPETNIPAVNFTRLPFTPDKYRQRL